MQHKTLKLSALAVLIAGATGANAAVYRVVEVTDGTDISSQQYFPEVNQSDITQRLAFYGQGITASSDENCFATSCDDSAFTLFGESRFGADGINYRDEVPFILDNLQRINDEDNLYRYCDSNLGPNTCREWARTQYYGNGYNTNDVGDRSGFGGLVREQEAWNNNFFSNATAVNGSSTLAQVDTFADISAGYDDDVRTALGTIVDSSSHKTTNSVINAQGTSAVGDYVLGISSGAYFDDGQRYARQFNKRGFVNLGDNKVGLAPAGSDSLTATAGQSLAWDAVEYNDQLLVVGSASYDRSSFNDTDNKVPDNYGERGDPTFNEGTYRDCPKTFEEKGLESFYATKECQLSVFANDGVFWTLDGSTSGNVEAQLLAKNDLATLDPDENDRSFQAGARAVELVNGQPVVVGFTTDRYDNDYYAMRASVWELPADATSASAESFERTLIPGLALESGGDRVLTYTLATDVNANNKVIGVAKNFRADNRSYVERMFVYDNAAKPDAPTFLNASISPIFFDGANGYPAAINNSNQIVGRLDSESVNQVDGRFRRQRAFTYAMGEIEGSAALKRGDAYFLDDLVNDGNTNGNANKYRIFEATGINDAGVISATAYKCEGGYDDLTTDSFCQGGEPGVERIVAVKLIPIAASDEPSVVERPESEASVERSGASLGMLAMAFLGFLGFRRRK
ncbi:hypothetical protein RJ45_10150 [Photobacterium gaetbulicola]|uniref:GlyGly-CTERM sorting domain-containing protein n=1 Tax=Photobacterium gaetbulicola TaxID=1295392 RepID=A0A0B9GG67_9GAMM|nr:DUF3466 family protein [Photobacterium gaetbulicola]KHT63710.1 hypothetical protein RJ45_10150 [Photobacterium gaetbulicola]